jgi:glycosyltransferase involved in cell wall biosynthesis
MKLGIIIICYNNENDIDISLCIKHLNKVKDIEICFVNNNSKDNTYDILKEVKERCKNVSIVDVKKFKSDNSAVKAGARFMSSQFNLKYLGFINTNVIIEYENLCRLIEAIGENQVDISKYDKSKLNKKGIKLTMFQSLFPVMDYLAEINVENQYNDLDYQG